MNPTLDPPRFRGAPPQATERPILFSSLMVRAILEGRKTQTRRITKPQHAWAPSMLTPGYLAKISPYGKPGDHLWVRETCLNNALDGYPPVWFYRADDEDKPDDRKWKPSIFMPRAASRITLEVTGLKVERLNDISERDAIAEGITWPNKDGKPYRPPIDFYGMSRLRIAADRFHVLWDSLNSKRGFGWRENPWVWVISFRKL
jgi:hypothetical protein